MIYTFFFSCYFVVSQRKHAKIAPLQKHPMQIPDDWSHKQRSGVALNLGNTGNALKTPKNISSTELDKFADEASVHHVNVNSLFLRSVSNNAKSVSERILSLLPNHNDMHVEKSETDVAVQRSDESSRSQSRKRKHGDPKESTSDPTTIIPAEAKTNAPFSRSDMRLELDTLLSRLPYKRMMQEMIPHADNSCLPSVPSVSRLYEEGFMREKVHANERPCVMGDECECMFIDKNNPFVGIEFLVPGEEPGTMCSPIPLAQE